MENITHLIAAYQRGDKGASNRLYEMFDEALDRNVDGFEGKVSWATFRNESENMKQQAILKILERARDADLSEEQYFESYMSTAHWRMDDVITEAFSHGLVGDATEDCPWPSWTAYDESLEVKSKDDHEKEVDLLDFVRSVANDDVDMALIDARVSGKPSGLNPRTERHRVQRLEKRYDDKLARIEGLAAPTLAT
jgi:hypothetical protein